MDIEPRHRPGGRSARVTRRVRDAALATLLEVGLANFSIDEVARRAGVAKTTIYRRWGTRENLVVDTVTANSAQQIAIADTGSLRDDLRTLALQVRDAVTGPASRRLMAALATAHSHAELVSLSRRFWATRLAAVRPIVDRAIARGELAADVDADVLVIRVVGPIWFAVFGPERDPDDAFVTGTVDAILAGYSVTTSA